MFSKQKEESRLVGLCVRSTIPLAFRSEKPSERALFFENESSIRKAQAKASRPNSLLAPKQAGRLPVSDIAENLLLLKRKAKIVHALLQKIVVHALREKIIVEPL